MVINQCPLLLCGSLTNSRNISGIANNVSRLEKASPQTIAVATGPHISDSPPSPSASDDNPAIVVKVVINIGMTRRRAAYIVAWVMLMPSCSRVLAAEMRTMAALTAMPASATTPYKVYRLSGLLVINNPKVTPVNAIGTVDKMIKGWK